MAEQKKPETKTKKIMKRITTGFAILLALAIIGLIFVYVSPSFGLYFVKSGSMRPVINPGDIVITGPVGEVRTGNIITFEQGEAIVTHRVIAIENGKLRTKGDANEDPDTDPEGDDPDDTANGDLDNLLYVAFLIDLDNNGIDTGDKYLKTDNTIGTVGEGESWADIDALASAFEAMEDDAYPSITTNLSNDGTVQFYFYYNFPNNNAADNEAQGDSVQMDFQFELRQS